MKVVLFCGGEGLRLREYSESVPKPMAPIGIRPILWHVMRFYAHYGFKDFVLCLGYKAEMIKDYFLRYNEALSNDFVLSQGGQSVDLLSSDIQDWRITFVDTGLHALVGERLKAVEKYLDDDEFFLASYGDCLTDAPIDRYVQDFRARDLTASFLCVRPSYSFHVVDAQPSGLVKSIHEVRKADLWINGGYFVLRREVLDGIRKGEDLVVEPFQRLAAAGKLLAYRYEGFWMSMDTIKEMQQLERLYQSGDPPWAVWRLAADQPAC